MKQSDTFEYKGYTFTRIKGMWTAVKGQIKFGPNMYRNDLKEQIDIYEKKK